MSARSTPVRRTVRPESAADVLAMAIARLPELLPAGWSVERLRTSGSVQADELVEVTGPDGTAATLALDAKLTVETRTLAHTLDSVRRRAEDRGGRAEPVLVVRYIPSRVRQALERHGTSYMDTTGNVRISLDRPTLFLRDRGADTDPWRGRGRPVDSLRGEPAGRIVRALVDFTPPVTVPELGRRAGTSPGATYRAVDLLAGEELLVREPRKAITDVRWRALIERWSTDYGFQSGNVVTSYLSPRGIDAVTEGLAALRDESYAITGSLAAQRLAPYAPPRLATLYADDPETLATRLGLRPVDTNGNVLIARSGYSPAFQRLREADGLRFVAPSQAAVDLLTGPGRAPAEAEALLDWMQANEREWRE